MTFQNGSPPPKPPPPAEVRRADVSKLEAELGELRSSQAHLWTEHNRLAGDFIAEVGRRTREELDFNGLKSQVGNSTSHVLDAVGKLATTVHALAQRFDAWTEEERNRRNEERARAAAEAEFKRALLERLSRISAAVGAGQ